MGSLARWGAVSGFGAGLQEIAETKKDDRVFQAEEDRAMRLADWKSKQEDRRAVDKREHDIDTTELTAKLAEEKSEEADFRRFEFDAEQKEKDRKSREKVAGINKSAKLGSSLLGRRDDIYKMLDAGKDVDRRTEVNPYTYENTTVKYLVGTSKGYAEWNRNTGSLDFPKDRDPVDLASRFKDASGNPLVVDEDEDNIEKIRDIVIGRMVSQEDILMSALDTPNEIAYRSHFRRTFGYLPFQFSRYVSARKQLQDSAVP